MVEGRLGEMKDEGGEPPIRSVLEATLLRSQGFGQVTGVLRNRIALEAADGSGYPTYRSVDRLKEVGGDCE